MKNKQFVSREEWLQARLELLEQEKALTRARDALSARRRDMPWVKLDKPYTFDGPDGTIDLAGLFGDCSQLIVYHFMFHPDWDAGCKSCSFWADNYAGIIQHLRQRDTQLVTVSRAARDTLAAFQQRMGWDFDWYSSLRSDFNADFGVSFSPEQIAAKSCHYNYQTCAFAPAEAPGISVFSRDNEGIYHSYSTYARGLDMLNVAYHYLDLTPKGRDEDELPFTMAWVDHHDRYE